MFPDYTKARALQEQRFLNTAREPRPVRVRHGARLRMWVVPRRLRIAAMLRPSSLVARNRRSSHAT